MKKKITIFLAVIFLFSCTGVHADISFEDVGTTAWYYESVKACSEMGLINGIDYREFKPKGTLTFAEAIKLAACLHSMQTGDNALKATVMGHWADKYYNYAVEKGIIKSSDFSKADYSSVITRKNMFYIFANALPADEYTIINDFSFMPEQTTNEYIKKLYAAGVAVGNEHGFEEEKTITRAETAAIVHRLADKSVRVSVNATYYNKTVIFPEITIIDGQVQTDKPYTRIPNTNWKADPTGGVTIKSKSGYINTKYGNHRYGASGQGQYNKLISLMDEAFNYACQQEQSRVYRGGGNPIDTYAKSEKTIKFYQNELGIFDREQMMSMGITATLVSNMQSYLFHTYALSNDCGTNPDAQNNNVYKYLFQGGELDCDGLGNFNMLCWDYLGFSTRMISSHKATHACAEVYINGHWVILDQLTGKFDKCTHEQLMELLSGIKNDAYSASRNTEPFVNIASRYVDEGIKHSDYPSDLCLDRNENATHTPDDYTLN